MSRRGGAAWCAVGAALLLPALWLAFVPAAHGALDWRPDRIAQAWRWWSAAWVHLSTLHLIANLAGGALVVALGLAARVAPRAALAWLAAWPLTHLALALQPELVRYGGLSGVLHAGVAVVAIELLLRSTARERALGTAIAVGLALKVVLEAPWRGALAHPEGWDIAVAPLAHAAGAIAGGVCAAAAAAVSRSRKPSP